MFSSKSFESFRTDRTKLPFDLEINNQLIHTEFLIHGMETFPARKDFPQLVFRFDEWIRRSKVNSVSSLEKSKGLTEEIKANIISSHKYPLLYSLCNPEVTVELDRVDLMTQFFLLYALIDDILESVATLEQHQSIVSAINNIFNGDRISPLFYPVDTYLHALSDIVLQTRQRYPKIDLSSLQMVWNEHMDTVIYERNLSSSQKSLLNWSEFLKFRLVNVGIKFPLLLNTIFRLDEVAMDLYNSNENTKYLNICAEHTIYANEILSFHKEMKESLWDIDIHLNIRTQLTPLIETQKWQSKWNTNAIMTYAYENNLSVVKTVEEFTVRMNNECIESIWQAASRLASLPNNQLMEVQKCIESNTLFIAYSLPYWGVSSGRYTNQKR